MLLFLELNPFGFGMSFLHSIMAALSRAFQRKGIIGGVEDDLLALDPKILALLEQLKKRCATQCETGTPGVQSALQLWKERSLYQTLQALDAVQAPLSSAANGVGSHEKQMQAIELHEQAGLEINDTLKRMVALHVEGVHRSIDEFASELAPLLYELINPQLQAELANEQAIVARLLQDKQQRERDQQELTQQNEELAQRVEALETAPDGGGDAILCRKLRAKCRDLTTTQHDLESRIHTLQTEHDKALWEASQIRAELELQKSTLVMTKAMHEKETKQLVTLVHMKQKQFEQVLQATATANSPSGAFDIYDPHSGQSVRFVNASPQKPGASPNKTRLVCSPPAPRSPTVKLHVATPPKTPKARGDSASNNSSVVSNCDAWQSLPSPTAKVVRPFGT